MNAASPAPPPARVPEPVRRVAGDAPLRWVWTNERGGATWQAGQRFIKWNPRGSGLDLEAERPRLQWAEAWHPVPRVLD